MNGTVKTASRGKLNTSTAKYFSECHYLECQTMCCVVCCASDFWL